MKIQRVIQMFVTSLELNEWISYCAATLDVSVFSDIEYGDQKFLGDSSNTTYVYLLPTAIAQKHKPEISRSEDLQMIIYANHLDNMRVRFGGYGVGVLAETQIHSTAFSDDMQKKFAKAFSKLKKSTHTGMWCLFEGRKQYEFDRLIRYSDGAAKLEAEGYFFSQFLDDGSRFSVSEPTRAIPCVD